jgi:hypothetical protein
MRGEDDYFKLIKYLDSISIVEDLPFEFADHLVGRVVHNPDEGLRDIDEDEGFDFLYDIMEESIDGPACEVGERKYGALLVREDADIVLALDGEIFDNLSDLECVFINILLVRKGERTQLLQDEHLGHAALAVPRLEFSKQLHVDGDEIEGRGGDDQYCFLGGLLAAVGWSSFSKS